MKFFITFLVIVFSFSVQAQTPEQMKMIKRFQNMTPEQMQAEAHKMKDAMTEMGKCTEGLDMNKMKELETRGKAITAKVDELCAAGKEAEAEAYAMKEGRKLSNDPMIAKMRECSKNVKMPNFDFTPGTKAVSGERKSICEK